MTDKTKSSKSNSMKLRNGKKYETKKCASSSSDDGDSWIDDETYDVAAWGTDGECYSCGTRVTVCCPADKEQEANYEY
jgi:hypothetical protein